MRRHRGVKVFLCTLVAALSLNPDRLFAQEAEEYNELPKHEGAPVTDAPPPIAGGVSEKFKIESNDESSVEPQSPSSAVERRDAVSPQIPRGHAPGTWILRGGGDLDLAAEKNGGARLRLNSGVSYFVVRNLAAGLRLEMDAQTGRRAESLLGPSLTYYFWRAHHVGAYADANFLWSLASTDLLRRGGVGGGLDFYLSPRAALGPSVQLRRVNARSGNFNQLNLSFGAALFF